jgi:hypothetical protein
MELDIYAWLSYRLFVVTKREASAVIPWAAIASQFPGDYSRPRRFRADFHAALLRVLSIHPTAQVSVNEVGVVLAPSPKFIKGLERAG